MSFSNRMSRVKDQTVETVLETLYDKASESEPPGISLRIGSSRSIVVSPGVLGANCWPVDGGASIGVEKATASGISARQTYPARRTMYSQSATAKYASVTRM